MQMWKRMLLAGTALGSLLMSGCNEVVLENPLPSVVDDRIVGSWATPDGKLSMVIRKGEGQGYLQLSADDLKNNKNGSVFYLAQVGTTMFAETAKGCDQFYFKPPSATDAPNGCWDVVHVVLTANSLQEDVYDSGMMVRKSVAGGLREVGLQYGVSAGKGSSSSDFVSDVLIEGAPTETAPFLELYSGGAVYSSTTKLHKI